MSDVNIAPAPASAPAAPAPSAPAGEVVINQNPTNSPQPVGSQAPEKPVGDVERGSGRPETRRESIKRAFDRAQENSEQPKKAAPARPKAVNADKASAKPDAEQGELNLKQRPAQHREGGRFAKAPEGAGTAQQPIDAQQRQQQAAKPAVQLPENAPYREPLPRMSERARAEWAAAPESVRGEVHRMAQEFDGAYRKYRGDHETMNSIRHFHDLATQHGTTLDRALNNYVSMEKKLREDVVGGLDVIVNNLNLRTPDGRKLGLRDVAYHILNQSPEQHRMVQNQNATQAASHQIGQLHEMVGNLAQSVQRMQYDGQFRQTRSAVDQFADSHPGFDEVGDLIEQELRLGFDLETAYQRAIRLRPPTQAAQTRAPSAQTRTDKSIHGAPSGGASNASSTRRDGKPVGRRDAIANAIKRVNGGV